MIHIIIEINMVAVTFFTVYKMIVGAIRTIASTVDYFDGRIFCSDPECPRKTRTVVIGNKGGIGDIYVVATVAAIPFQGVLRIVLNL